MAEEGNTRPMDDRDLFGDSDSELSSVVDSDEDRAASSSDEGEGRDDDYEKPKKKLTIKLKGPAASGEGKPKTKKRRDGETGEDGEKKKKKKKKDKKKEKVPEPEGELDPEQQRKKEVDDDFKEALQVLKPKRSKKREDEDSTRWDGLAMTLKDDMMSAAMTDTEFRRNGQPSVAKLMQLQSIMEKLGRTDLQDVFLDNGILVAIHAWMEPSDVDGTLPPLDVQKSMLGVLEKYDVDANFIDRLRESKVGWVINYMTKDDEVLPDVRKRCQALVDKWSKFVMDKYANKERNSQRSPHKLQRRERGEEGDQDQDGTEYRYARIPKPMSFDVTVRPKSEWTASEARKSGKGDEPSRFKQLASVLKSGKSGGRAAPKVLQG